MICERLQSVTRAELFARLLQGKQHEFDESPQIVYLLYCEHCCTTHSTEFRPLKASQKTC